MATQQLNASAKVRRSFRSWWLFGSVLAFLVGGVFTYILSQGAPIVTTVSSTKVNSSQAVQNPATHAGPSYVANGYNGLPNRSGEQPGLYNPPVPQNGSDSIQTVPDAATGGISGYLQPHAYGKTQLVPDAATQGVLGYIQAHQQVDRAYPSSNYVDSWRHDLSGNQNPTSTVPDAATRGVQGYIQAHVGEEGQGVPKPAQGQ